MPDIHGHRPPLVCQWLIRLASWIVPRHERSEWRARWYSGVRDWWILVERGELTRHASAQFKRHCRNAFSDAFWLRFSKREFQHWLGAASFPLAAAAALLVALALTTRGFAVTRSLVEIARTLNQYPPSDDRGGALIAYGLPIVFGLFTALVLVCAGRVSWRLYSWRYWAFFAAKSVSVMVILPLAWIEGGAAFRAMLPHPQWSALIGGLLLAIAFVAVFARALLWSFSDQRRRCPVCLRLLAMPVTMGSWASMFEPVTTEMLCDEGHGSLSMTDGDLGEPDRWVTLDASWRDLFETAPGDKRGV